MRKHLIALLIGLGLVGYANATTPLKADENQTVKISKILVIDLDRELKEIQKRDTRGNKEIIIDTLIFLKKYHKKISFIGKLLQKNAPISIDIVPDDNVDNDEVTFKPNQYSINTQELKDGDHIIMKDKNGKIFADKVVRKSYK